MVKPHLIKFKFFSNQNNLTLFQLIEKINQYDLNINNGTKQKLLDFLNMIKHFQILNENNNALETLNVVLKRIGIVNLLRK